ncbi:MAG: hypothetical protein NWF09_00140 [Candidatus Bathyarchaeota archaeon]|nr:hypothetical protein [Candidatus Bathyarchaeota archaeon]
MREGIVSRIRFFISFMALDKPWFYLFALFASFTIMLVWLGNPLLPAPSLQEYGLAWHHIPEIISFLLFGMWLGSLGYLSTESLTYSDFLTLVLTATIILAYAKIISYLTMFPIVLTIALIPSFAGYFTIRLYQIRKAKL